jgi:hypothetical protein
LPISVSLGEWEKKPSPLGEGFSSINPKSLAQIWSEP